MSEWDLFYVVSHLQDAVLVGGVHETKGGLHDDVVETE